MNEERSPYPTDGDETIAPDIAPRNQEHLVPRIERMRDQRIFRLQVENLIRPALRADSATMATLAGRPDPESRVAVRDPSKARQSRAGVPSQE